MRHEETHEVMPITRMVDGKSVRMDKLPADMLERMELVGQLNDRLEAAIVSGDWSAMLKLEQMFLAMANLCRKEIDNYGNKSTLETHSPSAGSKRVGSPTSGSVRKVTVHADDGAVGATARNIRPRTSAVSGKTL